MKEDDDTPTPKQDIDTSNAFSSIMSEITATEGELELIEEDDGSDMQDITRIRKESEGAPVVKMVNFIILNAIKKGASDIHIEPFEKFARIRYRIDGILQLQPAPPRKIYNSIVARLKVMASLDVTEKRRPQDGRIKVRIGNKEIDLRSSFLPSNFGEKVVMRILDSSSLCLDLTQLGFDKQDMVKFNESINEPNGIILVTGPTGSGKTTTLYSTLTALNRPDVNIITIEDPVEYVLKGIIQVQTQNEVGLTFAAGLRSFLRQDPDIIMVGEIRDKETAEISINAALTGHLVLSTLHTNDAPSVVSRLDNMGIEPYHISSTVILALAQRLVRKICTNCKRPYEVDADILLSYGLLEEDLENFGTKATLYKGEGCNICSESGYKGRIGIYEIMKITENLKILINDRAPTNEIKAEAVKGGMRTLREASLKKVLDGDTSIDEMLRVTSGDS
ncbi:MAG: Flp pilus assembly complex ATPase component TadA [Elusimicrobia bacterium]|nr:Flp pilus assembly complex ATPase component TadA [Elusimicrobiota bacterium]